MERRRLSAEWMRAGAVRRLILTLGAVGMLWAAASEPPEQPLPFSHKAHAGTLKLACKMCHTNPDPGESMLIVRALTCMQCHSAIKTDSPAIQKLAQYAKEGRDIPWVRVYEVPSFVAFTHRTHNQTGNACEDCHGPVRERERLAKEGDISMGGCMKCHRAKKVSTDCTFCHDQR